MLTRIPHFPLGRFEVVAIGASTGAPGQVEEILASLPADLPFAVLIAQHLPPAFSKSFAVQLDAASPLSVVVAEDGMAMLPSVAYVGPGRQHLRVRRSLGGKVAIEVSEKPSALPFKPSADELFASCAAIWRARTLGIVMTGIGKDGTLGAGAIHAAGGMVIAQTAETCAVYGMPKSCVEAGYADAQLSPRDIARAVLQLSPQHHLEAAV